MDVDVRISALRLSSCLDALAQELGQQFLSTDGTRDTIFRAYAADHGHDDEDATDL